MNIVSILKKLKEVNMISPSEEGIALFSDSFNKFGISLLLLNDEEKFSRIVNILNKNKIPLQKANGVYNLRIFAVDEKCINDYIASFSAIGEIDFLKHYPEMMTLPKSISMVLDNMKNYKDNQVSYKVGNDYNLKVLLKTNNKIHGKRDKVNAFLKTVLKDASLVDKVENNIKGDLEDNSKIKSILEKVENKISNDFVERFSNNWKVVIDGLEINSFQNVKNTINKIKELNTPVIFEDALIFVLFYKTSLDVSEIERLFNSNTFAGGR